MTVMYKQILHLLQISTYNNVYNYSSCVPLLPANIYLQLSSVLRGIMSLQSDIQGILYRSVSHSTECT